VTEVRSDRRATHGWRGTLRGAARRRRNAEPPASSRVPRGTTSVGAYRMLAPHRAGPRRSTWNTCVSPRSVRRRTGGPSTHPSALPAVPVARPFPRRGAHGGDPGGFFVAPLASVPACSGGPGGSTACAVAAAIWPATRRAALGETASRRSSPYGSTHGGWWRRAQRHPDRGSRTERLQVTAPRSGRSHGTGARPRGRDHVVAEVRYLRPPPLRPHTRNPLAVRSAHTHVLFAMLARGWWTPPRPTNSGQRASERIAPGQGRFLLSQPSAQPSAARFTAVWPRWPRGSTRSASGRSSPEAKAGPEITDRRPGTRTPNRRSRHPRSPCPSAAWRWGGCGSVSSPPPWPSLSAPDAR
jgi:hypothetical protein